MHKMTFIVKLCNMLKMDGKLMTSEYLQVDDQIAIYACFDTLCEVS